MEGKDKIAQRHLDVLPILLRPLIEAKNEFKDITFEKVAKILREWDKAREI